MNKLVLSLAGVLLIAVSANASDAQPIHRAALKIMSGHELPRVHGEAIVMLSSSRNASGALSEFHRQGMQVLKRFDAINAVLVRFSASEGTRSYARALRSLAANPNVKSIEANAVYKINAKPNDERYAEQYALRNSGQTGGTSGADIGAEEAWNTTTGSKEVLIGVIDTGIDFTHSDLADNKWTNPAESGLDEEGNDKASNGIDDDGNGYIDDVHGWDFVNDDNDPFDDQAHGTHVAGTIGAKGNNGAGVSGVVWDVSLVAMKALDEGGSGDLDDLVEAILYSASIGVAASNNSWGGGGFSEAAKAAIEVAEKAGSLFIASAGNSSADNDLIDYYPSNYDVPNVISVGSIDHNDSHSSFSSFGATEVDILAPGDEILSTIPGNEYELLSGTSMAAPHVTGAAALVLSAFPELTHSQVKARILYASRKVESSKTFHSLAT